MDKQTILWDRSLPLFALLSEIKGAIFDVSDQKDASPDESCVNRRDGNRARDRFGGLCRAGFKIRLRWLVVPAFGTREKDTCDFCGPLVGHRRADSFAAQ
ncbi:hypothetical protein ACXYMO_10025 [Arenibacterium sp. CAU 1754]